MDTSQGGTVWLQFILNTPRTIDIEKSVQFFQYSYYELPKDILISKMIIDTNNEDTGLLCSIQNKLYLTYR